MADFQFSKAGTLKAWHDISLPGHILESGSRTESEGRICFHLTEEGLIVDIFDSEGNCIDTFAKTSQEFADWMLV